MTEWTVVLVLVTLLGLVTTVAKPVLRLNSAITRLTSRLDGIAEDLQELTVRNAQSHDRLWERAREQETLLQEHSRRLASLEAESGINRTNIRNKMIRGEKECGKDSLNC